MRLIARADYRQMKWKNGAGTTTQIAIHPEGATTDDFEWRISMAQVNDDGPFSAFPGAERSLAVLDGAGIALAVAGKTMRLTRESSPFAFAADIATEARLIDGPILDLNVMSRKDLLTHCLHKFSGSAEWQASTETIVLIARETGLHIDDAMQTIRLAPGDTVIYDGAPAGLRIVPENPGDYYLIAFSKI